MMSQANASTLEMLEIVEKRLARRRYFRDKQREHRRKVNADVEAAEAEVHHLLAILERLQPVNNSVAEPDDQSDSPLSWRSIASVFQREAHRVLTDHESLARQTKEYKALAAMMQTFVEANIPPPMSTQRTWQHASLAAEPNARRLGKEWLTQQMYHNMPEHFRRFPSTRVDEEFYHFDMEASDDDDSLMSMEVMQSVWPGTLATFRRFAESHMSAVVEESTGNTRLYHLTTPKGTFVNPLQGQFIEADRFVMVIRQVEQDEVHVCNHRHRQRHFMSWVEVRPVSATHIVVRCLSHISHFFRANEGYITVDELASLWEIDLTGVADPDKKAFVRRELIRLEHAGYVQWHEKVMALLRASQQS